MELIDKRGKINKVTFKQIIERAGEDQITIVIGDKTISTNANDLLLDLFMQEVQNDKSFELTIVCKDSSTLFTGKDFNWFLQDDRLADLSMYLYGIDIFTGEVKEKPVKTIKSIKPVKLIDTSIYHVATASLKDPENPAIQDFSGLKLECVKWLNQQIVQNANVQNEVDMLICLDYDANEPAWQTLKELFDSGKIDVC